MLRRSLLAPLLLAASPALAQPPSAAERRDPRRAEMDRLFEALRDAPDEAGAMLVEQRIRQAWAESASPAAVLLLRRGVRNMQGSAPDEAVEDFDAAIVLSPGAAEAWHLRAQAHAAMGDANAAGRDLQEALRLEPRHFGALMTLSALQAERRDYEGALRSLEAALALYPKMAGGEARRRELRRRAVGEEM